MAHLLYIYMGQSSGSENGKTKQPRHRAHSTGRKTGQRPEWNDIADCSPTYKSYWAQWKSFAVRNSTLECNWESTNGWSQIAQTVIPRSRVKDMRTELHSGPSGYLGVNKILNNVQKYYYWLQTRGGIERWCLLCGKSRAPNQGSGPHAPIQCWGPIQKDNHRCSSTLPIDWPKKPIPPDRYGFFYKVPGSLQHSQSGGFDSGGSSNHQILLPFRNTPGAT
jgi:hypothetical protein